MSIYKTSLFIFRRDLRLRDNSALNQALRLSRQVIPCFILDPRQLEPHPYQSKPGLQFMLQSLADVQQQLQAVDARLALYRDLPDRVVDRLHSQQQIQAVFINRDYTPFSLKRDRELANVCQRLGIALHTLPDALLNEPELAVKNDRTPYKVFTAFYNNARQIPVAAPQDLAGRNFMSLDEDTVELPVLSESELAETGGRGPALVQLAKLGDCVDYQCDRDFPALEATTRLSAHLKFGTCSVREAYWAVVEQLGVDHPLIRQLYWRDFFTHIGYHFPQVFGRAFIEKFDGLVWDNNPDYFQAWCDGKTGFPIVDAGMRELNATGYMHNRVRMITASFLVKDLRIDWRWGERYFARQLVDYDPCLNNGNWQWAASTGCDAQPYFRIFNPWLQQAKFDPDCRYIYRWLPELRGIPIKTVHRWNKQHQVCAYPAPIVDHDYESKLTKAMFKELSSG
ncbi:MAG: cryptochrome/photolyase family protein [Methylobacter sp.]